MKPMLNHKVPHGEFHVYSERPSLSFFALKQIHSDKIVPLQKKDILPEADGVFINFSSRETQNLCILTADCLPIFIAGKKGVAIVHGGWRGLHSGILLKQELYNLEPHYAYIGPHICKEHYQVGKEFKKYFPRSNCLLPDKLHSSKLKLDLLKEAKFQLKQLNHTIKIESSPLCTFKSQELHSFRQDSTMSRNWNIFVYRG